MNLMTKDLLINFLIILFPIFLLQMSYLVKYVYRLDALKGSFLSIFPILSLVLCMLFPVVTEKDFVWDLRWIPFLLGGLYGGYRLGIILIVITLLIRYLTGGENGLYISCITFPLIGVSLFFISKYYLKMSVSKKIFIGISLIFIVHSLTQFISTEVFELTIGISIWKQYFTIQVIGIVVVILLWEVILTNFQVLEKLVKAEKLQIVSHLAASISHEVRNPLTVTRGYIQMLSEDVSPNTKVKYANIALKELDRATDVINDYLTFAAISPENKERLMVSEEIQHVVNSINPLANDNGIELKLSLFEDEAYYIMGERKKFQQCLFNILKNGIESMQDDGEIYIHLIHAAPTIQIKIQDQGSGMTQEQIYRLGEPYFTTKNKGTGLGMMVSYSVIKSMDGSIHVSSVQGKGTCFSINLPIHRKEPI
ncbi:HAMP domain-containing sensor histidine kinase [Peribacillus sp. ACCC06369]|uniref:sensor histidine kinase n=1 Tax=Peribacillus sp. ACCC06369 TaxID=3055860 RepID=UPI0025A1DB21|nr:HAMP domain-containing sensor histidine kinase [Peribacillus sp. ACCC06369]MDM5358895.1 HAMP domain-containing sensor histidine kinase [Peribacillus sp. ACCC06369]